MLDAVDKKVLQTIYDQAREPFSKLARRAGVTRDVFQQRIEKLERAGVIKGYRAQVPQGHISEGVGSMYFKLIRNNEEEFSRIVEAFKKHTRVNWMAELCGNYDLVITFLFHSSEDMGNTITEFNEIVEKSVRGHDFTLYVAEYKFSRKGLIYGKEEKNISQPISKFQGSKQSQLKIDSTDLRILDILCANCRTTNKTIAAACDVSEDTIRNRIKKLEEQGTIFGYYVTLNIAAMGLESSYLQLHLENFDDRTRAKLRAYAAMNPHIVYASWAAGKYNVIMSIESKSRKEFNEHLVELRNTFGGQLIDYQFQLLMQEFKESYIPEGFINELLKKSA